MPVLDVVVRTKASSSVHPPLWRATPGSCNLLFIARLNRDGNTIAACGCHWQKMLLYVTKLCVLHSKQAWICRVRQKVARRDDELGSKTPYHPLRSALSFRAHISVHLQKRDSLRCACNRGSTSVPVVQHLPTPRSPPEQTQTAAIPTRSGRATLVNLVKWWLRNKTPRSWPSGVPLLLLCVLPCNFYIKAALLVQQWRAAYLYVDAAIWHFQMPYICIWRFHIFFPFE